MKLSVDCYDPERRVFPRFAQTDARGELTAKDILLILKWKLGRIKDINARTISERSPHERQRYAGLRFS
jgi:hypothetical protein